MAQTTRFLLPIRASLSAINSFRSTLSLSRIPFYEKCQYFNSWTKGFQPSLHNCAPRSPWKLCQQRYHHHLHNVCKSGRELGMGSILGVTVVLGSISFGPRIAYSMDGFDTVVNDQEGLFGSSESEVDPETFLTFLRKLLVPVVLILTVLMNWGGHPIILAAKVILILLSTKPSPFSVYLFVEELRRQSMRQHPFIYKFMSLYAKKVDVEDYTFLCVARVELNGQKFTLIGILGSWWVLSQSTGQRAFSLFKNIAPKTYHIN